MGAIAGSKARRLGHRVCLAVLATLPVLTLMIVLAPVAFAVKGGTTPKPATEAPPSISYVLNWPIFLLCVVLVLGFYAFMYTVSFREFKKVVDGRFGPKR